MQALYQWYITGRPVSEIISEFEDDRAELKKADRAYFRLLLMGSEENAQPIDHALAPFLDRKLEALDPVERAILHLGVYELKYQPQLPRPVILNEAIELAKMFGAEESYKYINGVLDKAAVRIRENK